MKRQTGRKILSMLLCLALVLIQGNLLSVYALDSDKGSFTVGLKVITEFEPLDEMVAEQTVLYGTALEELLLPGTLRGKGYICADTENEPISEPITIEGVRWTAEPDYHGTAGVYRFYPDLSEYLVQTGSIPAIVVTVEEQAALPDDDEAAALDASLDITGETGDDTTENTNQGAIDNTDQDTLEKENIPEEENIVEEKDPPETGVYTEESTDVKAEADLALEEKDNLGSENAPEADMVLEDGFILDDEIDPAVMAAGLENSPKIMTLEDIPADFQIQTFSLPQGGMFFNSLPVATHPQTIVIGADNENNAHTGISDGDIDYNLSSIKANYPIEVSFNLDNLPTESAYIALKAFDVDEEAGELDYVFINDAPAGPGVAGQSIGRLSGNDNTWNTTVLKIPLSKLKLGKNYVSLSITRGWWVTVDWIQIILDGGAVDPGLSDFSIKLEEAVQSGNNVEIIASVNITQSGSTEYYTEYMLTNSAGDNLASYFGTAAGTETATLSMPLDSPTGTYTVTGLIKDKLTEAIKASDTITFDFARGELPVFGPKVSHTLSPSTLTNGDVTIRLSAINADPEVMKDVQIWYGGGNITGSIMDNITTANQSVSANGTYDFTVKFTRYGVLRTTNYSVAVSNIDKVSPVITANDLAFLEDTGDADVLAAINNAITVTDDVSLPANPFSVSPTTGFAGTLDEKTVTITATDTVGNESTKNIKITVIPKPIKITQHEASADQTQLTASLSATLDYTGGFAITESGFVWGIAQNPTLEVNNGKTTVLGAVAKGGSISATAGDIVKGINYYARAYVKTGEAYYYSDQRTFGIGMPQFGSFSVTTAAGDIPAGGGTAIFTISRPSGQTENSQTVYYRTVNSTAIGGLHFQHKTGTVTFAEGEASKTVSVIVNGVSMQYGSNPATAYQNIGRSFYLEIYKVTGGATIGTSKVKKTIAPDSSKLVSADAYNTYNSVGIENYTNCFIRDKGYSFNSGSRDTVTFSSLRNTEAAYLDSTADHYALKYDLTIAEDDDGYQWIQVTDNTTELYFVKFEHKRSGYDPTRITYTFPIISDAQAASFYPSSGVSEYRGTLADSNKAVNIGQRKTVYINYDASGDGDDDWYKDDFKPYIRAIDITEPQLLAVAPMAGGAYAYGDEIYVSLIFNEIIGSVSGVTIYTNLSGNPFTYVEGQGTNVLVFQGRLDYDGTSFASIEVSAINGSENIKDLANNSGVDTENTNGTTGIDANTIRPIVGFADSSTGTLPRHTARVSIGSAVSAKYAWSQSTAMPITGWKNFSGAAGGTLTETLAGGPNGTSATWYLHVLATHENGNTRWENKSFVFQQPTMSLAADNTNWSQSRNISLTITKSGSAPVSIAMTGPETGIYTESQNINVTTAGTYTFSLTDGYGSSIADTVEVLKIDRIKPVIIINEYGNTETKYTLLDFGASAADTDGSGLSSLHFAWSNGPAVPESGWTAMALTGGNIPSYSTVGTAYLHIKAVDNAGNTAYASSQGYTVMSNTPPSIEVTGGALSTWQQDSIEINYTVYEAGAAITYISAADSILEDLDLPPAYPYHGSVSVSQNGMYTFMVMDENGLSDTKSVVVNYIDKEPPVASFSYGSGNTAVSWAQSKTVTVNAHDNSSPVVGMNGSVSGYNGSGVASVAWKKGLAGTYADIENGGDFSVHENAIYYVQVTDNVGNSTEYALPISGIDTNNPVMTFSGNVSVSIPESWYNTPQTVSVTIDDNGSDGATYSSGLLNNTRLEIFKAGGEGIYPAEPTATVNITSGYPEETTLTSASLDTGKYKITVSASDRSGNQATQTRYINVDVSTPELQVTGYTSGIWIKNDVSFNLSSTAPSGVTYKVRTRASALDEWSPWTDISNGAASQHLVSESTLLEFKAVSGSGKESAASAYTVRIDKTAPAGISISGASEAWQSDNIILTVSASDNESGIKEFYVSTDGGTTFGEAQAWNPGGTNQFTVSSNGDYTNKIKVKVSDIVGNISTASMGYTVRIDKVTPAITVSAKKGTAAGDPYAPGQWTNGNVVFTLGNTASQLSGTVFMVNIGGAGYEAIDGSAYTISADTNNTYRFKAVSGAGLSEESSTFTVRIQKSLAEEMSASMLSPAPNTEAAWYNTNTIIAVDKPTANPDKPSVSVKYKLWDEPGTEPLTASTLMNTTIVIPSDGKWTLKIWTEDEAGNTTAPIIESYFVDTAVPVIESVQYETINGNGTFNPLNSFSPDGSYLNKNILVTVTVSDTLSTPATVSYRLGVTSEYGEDITLTKASDTYTATFNLPLETNNTLSIKAKDAAGNETGAPTTTSKIIIENHAPVITFCGAAVTTESDDTWLQGPQTVTAEANDSPNGEITSSLENMSVIIKRWNGTAYAEEMTEISRSFDGISSTGDTPAKSHNIQLLSSGKYEITVTANDRAGNAAVLQTRYINLDLDAPAGDPALLLLDGIEVDSNEYYQASEYLVSPADEGSVTQSPIRAEYKLNNNTNTANNEDKWSNIPENNILAVLEGENTVQLRTVDRAGNTSTGKTYTVNYDVTPPTPLEFSPANYSSDQSIVPMISFTTDEPLVKGDGFLTVFNKHTNTKVMDVHSSNNRVKLSNEKKTVTVTLTEVLAKGTEYYILVDEGFVTDRAENKTAAFGCPHIWSFKTVVNPVIPDREIVILGYSVETISKAGADSEERSQVLTAVTDKETLKQHNIIAKADYSENGTDYYVKLKITPAMSAVPQDISVSTTAGTVSLSSDEKYIDVLIPQSASQAVVTISLGNGAENQFAIKIINSGYNAVLETSGGIGARADEGNLINSVDLSQEIQKAQEPNTTVNVTVKLGIKLKEKTELPDAAEIQQTVANANLLFLDITLEKHVMTTVVGGYTTTATESIKATQQPIVITIDLPLELQGNYNYQIIRKHNGVIDILPAETIENGTKLRFLADRFSTYTISYTPIPTSSTADSDAPPIIKTESGKKVLDLTELNLNTGNVEDINTLLPYYILDGVEAIVAFSAVIDGQMKWLAQEGKIYWIKSNIIDFSDIKDHWARNDILFTTARELFAGTGNGTFSPDMGMTRGMFVTVLGRLVGADVSRYTAPSYSDVALNAWYVPYVEWAKDTGIINGYGNKLFGPNDEITREQMAAIMVNLAKFIGHQVNIKNETAAFADADVISTWAKEAVKVMQEAGIISGKLNGYYKPKDTATRAEVAAVLKRFIEDVVR